MTMLGVWGERVVTVVLPVLLFLYANYHFLIMIFAFTCAGCWQCFEYIVLLVFNPSTIGWVDGRSDYVIFVRSRSVICFCEVALDSLIFSNLK